MDKVRISMQLNYCGDYAILQLDDSGHKLAASIRIDDVRDLFDLKDQVENVITIWQRHNQVWGVIQEAAPKSDE